jgi:hypothetical protein
MLPLLGGGIVSCSKAICTGFVQSSSTPEPQSPASVELAEEVDPRCSLMRAVKLFVGFITS